MPTQKVMNSEKRRDWTTRSYSGMRTGLVNWTETMTEKLRESWMAMVS